MAKPGKVEIEAEIVGLKDTIREAHETIQTLRLLLKEAKEFTDTLAIDKIDQAIGDQVKVGLETYQTEIMGAIEKAELTVLRRFEDLANTLLTGKARGG